MLEFSLGALCLLAAVTVIGHGIWVLLAAIVRAMTGHQRPAGELRRDCAACGSPRSVVGGRCRECGATPLIAPGSPPSDDVAAAIRQLDRLVDRGAITPQLRWQLAKALRDEAYSLRDLPAALPEGGAERAERAEAQPVAEEAPAAGLPPAEAHPGTSPFAHERDESELEIVVAEAVPETVTPSASPPQAVHPLDRAEPTARPPAPEKPLAALLQAFMEEKNIRWGEIIAGLVIVICAVGLVVSLWATLRDAIPYLPAFIFMLGTGAFHGAGHYTLRRWKLESISRAVLIIGTLLIPLNFLAAIALTGQRSEQYAVTNPTYLAAVVIGLAGYSAMTFFAGRALLSDSWWSLMIAVMGPSAGQLIINRGYSAGASTLAVSLLMCLPLISFLVAMVAHLWRARNWQRLSLSRAQPVLLVLGIGTFSFVAPVSLLLAKGADIGAGLAQLSPALSLFGAAILGTGLLIHVRTQARDLAMLRMSGTALAIVGAFVLLLMVVFAWPEPELLIAVGVVNCALLASLGFMAGLPILHFAAVACGALAYLVAVHWFRGVYTEPAVSGRQMFRSLVSGQSAVALTGFATAVAAAGIYLRRLGRAADAAGYLGGSAAVAAVSVLAAIFVGFAGWSGVALTAPVLILYAVALGAGGLILPDRRATWAASALLLVAAVQALATSEPIREALAALTLLPARPVLTALLVHASICALAAVITGHGRMWLDAEWSKAPRWREFVEPLCSSALITSLLAAPWVLWVRGDAFAEQAGYATVVALVWLAAALVRAWPPASYVGQLFGTVAVSYATAAVCQRQSWWSDQLLALQHLLAQVCVLAVWCLAWSTLRSSSPKRIVERLMPRAYPTVDQVLLGGLVGVLLVVALAGCAPGALGELGFNELAEAARVVEYQVGFGPWSWLAWALVTAALLVALYDRASTAALAGLLVAGVAAPLLLAGPFERQLATASALRWLLAGYGLVLTVPFCARHHLARAMRRIQPSWSGSPAAAPDPDVAGVGPALLRHSLQLLALVLSVLPVLVLTTLTVYQVTAGQPLGGPLRDSWFASMGTTWSYATPLGLATITLLVYAVRERQPGFALAGSAVFQYLASLGCLLPVLSTGTPVDSVILAELLQWNAVALGGYAVVWLALRRWIEPPAEQGVLLVPRASVLIQVGLALAAVGAIAILAAGGIVLSPADLPLPTAQLGQWLSYLALVLAMIAAIWCLAPPDRRRAWPALTAATLAGLTTLVAASLEPSSTPRNWLAYHTLMGGWAAAAALLTAAACVPVARRRDHTRHAVGWACGLGVLVVLLSLLACGSDPYRPWWSCGATGLIALLAGVLGIRLTRQTFAYASTLLAAAAVTFLWVGIVPLVRLNQLCQLSLWVLLAVTLVSTVWLCLELRAQRTTGRSFQPDFYGVPVHRFVGLLAVIGFSFTVFAGLAAATIERTLGTVAEVDISSVWSLLAAGSLSFLLVGTLWDRTARGTLSRLYAFGLAVLAVTIDVFELKFGRTVFAVGLAVSGYVALTGALWWRGANLAAWGSRRGISDAVAALRRASTWLPGAHGLLACCALLIGLTVVLAYQERALRMVAGLFPALLALGTAGLVQGPRRPMMQYLTLMLAGLAGVYLGWADIGPGFAGSIWLDRVIRLLVVLCALAFLFAVVVARRLDPESDWRMAVKQAVVTVAGGALVVLAAVLLLELTLFIENPQVGAPVDTVELLTVSVVMVGLIAALLAMAVLEGRDPLVLGEQSRMLYVYAAQAAGALLFAHIFLSRPGWFSEELRQYWPYIVMAIAFVGAGTGELFQRFGLRVLAEPLQRTGAFLPLLPAIGMWVLASRSDYALLLFGAGLLYVFLSISRKSTISAIAAGIAGNGALWSLWYQQGFAVWQQPQLWMIPPAVSVLAAAEINRRRLPDAALTAVRYASMLVIYLSSTGEMFIRGIGQELWPPMVLLALSMAGALLGLALRIRAFLYLGSTFVFLSVISMVWHASRAIQHVWPWWAFGIGLGLAILVLFGVFEKKREQVAAMVSQLREWEQ